MDTKVPNQIMREPLSSGEVLEFSGYKLVRSELARGKSRLDFHLAGDKLCFVKVKSCTLVREGISLFPDAPTERGRRHHQELARAHGEDYRACILFVIQREDARVFMPNDETDPDFGAALRKVVATGVEPIALATKYRKGHMELIGRVPVDLSAPK